MLPGVLSVREILTLVPIVATLCGGIMWLIHWRRRKGQSAILGSMRREGLLGLDVDALRKDTGLKEKRVQSLYGNWKKKGAPTA